MTKEVSSVSRYSLVAMGLHWLIAALIIFMILLGWRLDDHTSTRFELFQLHKSIGISILILSLLRLVWRFFKTPPAELPAPAWQQVAARLVHVGFYVIMIGLPLSGWAMVSASKIGVPTLLFHTVPWPHLPLPRSEALHDVFEGGHKALVWVTILLLGLHVGAALKHHFFDRDETIGRMVPGLKPGRFFAPAALIPIVFIGGAILAGELVLRPQAVAAKPAGGSQTDLSLNDTPEPGDATQLATGGKAVEPLKGATGTAQPSTSEAATATGSEKIPAEKDVPAWKVEAKASELSFTTAWSGTPIEGRFERWAADIRFDPDQLDKSKVKVKIALDTAATGDAERDGSLKGEDFFNTAKASTAVFTAKGFKKLSNDRYETQGTLNLRGVTSKITLRFTLKLTGDQAHAEGEADLDRLKFGVGQGQWQATDQIPALVKVKFKVQATRTSPPQKP